MSDVVVEIIRGGSQLKCALSGQLFMLYQSHQKTRELRPRACKLLKTHAPNEVPSHKKHLRQLGIERKKG